MNKSANYTLITVAINLLIAAILAYWLLTGSVNPLQDFIQFLQDFKLNFIVAFFSLIVSGVFFWTKNGLFDLSKK